MSIRLVLNVTDRQGKHWGEVSRVGSDNRDADRHRAVLEQEAKASFGNEIYTFPKWERTNDLPDPPPPRPRERLIKPIALQMAERQGKRTTGEHVTSDVRAARRISTKRAEQARRNRK